jgi:16S rRNA (adenine1518-N6/adenine1519-N6)-dimethyltransferase
VGLSKPVTLSEIRNILAERGIVLTKSLGQNFLHDANQLRRIADFGEVGADDQILEIGPGLGPLTSELVARASGVLAIEKDKRLCEFLEQHFAEPIAAGRLQLKHADALDVARDSSQDWSRWKLVSNLPYSVASPLLVELAQAPRSPERLVATLQLEVAERILAGPGDGDYGLLTVLIQANYQPRGMFKIAASCFFPEPDVGSACVRLIRRPVLPVPPEALRTFTRVVKRSFSQRRKMMLKLLRSEWPEEALLHAFKETGIRTTERAEKVSVDQFVQLAALLGYGRRSAAEMFDLVNEQDEVIGTNTRAEVHRLGLLHRAVHVLVFNSEGKLFLQKRSTLKDRHPGAWDSSSSGHVDSEEHYDQCAVRELREELGVDPVNPIEPWFKIKASPETDQEHVWTYRTIHEGPFKLDPLEIEKGGWFSPAEVTAWLKDRPGEFAPAFRLIWRLREQS